MSTTNTRLLVVRHGQDLDNARGILNGHRNQPLTASGWEHARQAGLLIGAHRPTVILTSPLVRAKQTAELIASMNGRPPVIVDDRLIERGFGVLTGQPVARIREMSSTVLETPKILYFLDAPGAESFDALLERTHDCLQDVCAKYAGQTVVLVSHGDTSKMLAASYQFLTWREALHRVPTLHNGGIFELAGGRLTPLGLH